MPSTFAVDSVQIGNNVPKSVSIADSAKVIQAFWTQRNNSALEFENEHLPLIFSPDDFWLLISLGVAQFLGQKENAEKHRKTFVDHEGKMELMVDGVECGIKPKSGDANQDDWPVFVAKIVDLIKQHTKTDTARVMTERFSTTGEVEATAFEVSLMEAMKNYFEYKCMIMCGIPAVTLEGNEQDYLSIIDRIDALISLLPDFEWYLKRVKDHMRRVLASLRGHPEIEWWKRMIQKVPMGSGGQIKITGWLSDFFPYVFDRKGKAVANSRSGADFTDFRSPAVTFTPVKMQDHMYTMKKYDMKLVGAFIGTVKAKTEDGKTALRPAIGWLMFYWKEEAL